MTWFQNQAYLMVVIEGGTHRSWQRSASLPKTTCDSTDRSMCRFLRRFRPRLDSISGKVRFVWKTSMIGIRVPVFSGPAPGAPPSWVTSPASAYPCPSHTYRSVKVYGDDVRRARVPDRS
jgi:hypothetical protein